MIKLKGKKSKHNQQPGIRNEKRMKSSKRQMSK